MSILQRIKLLLIILFWVSLAILTILGFGIGLIKEFGPKTVLTIFGFMAGVVVVAVLRGLRG